MDVEATVILDLLLLVISGSIENSAIGKHNHIEVAFAICRYFA